MENTTTERIERLVKEYTDGTRLKNYQDVLKIELEALVILAQLEYIKKK